MVESHSGELQSRSAFLQNDVEPRFNDELQSYLAYQPNDVELLTNLNTKFADFNIIKICNFYFVLRILT
jgi:hypothetical protein